MTHLRVASYNIRKTVGLDRKRNPARILAVLNQLDADVIALQEADFRLGQRHAALSQEMIKTETDYDLVPVAKNSVSIGWHGNAILIRKGCAFGPITGIDLPGLEPRGAVRLDLKASFGVQLMATHLGLTRRHRQKQLHAIRSALRAEDNAIILGDFNEWSTSKGLQPLQQDFNVHAPGKTFHAARPIAALDRIAVSPRIQLMNAGVIEEGLALRASDHLPIWADLAVPVRYAETV